MDEPSGRTVRDLRRSNRAVLLRHLYFEGPLSRHELGRATGLSSGTVSNVAAELLAEGVLEEAGSIGSYGGRPRTLLRVAPGSGYLIGVDIGETRVRVELFDLTLRELARSEEPLSGDGHDVVLVVRLVDKALAAVLSAARVPAGRLLGVGMGVPGIPEKRPGGGNGRRSGGSQEARPRDAPGTLVHGQTIGWDAVPLEALIRRSGALPPDLPLIIDNGARTLGQAEMWFGAGRGAREAVIALIGSGVGACVVTGGQPYGGAAAGAGEWGHTVLNVGGRRCRCGARGCLEAYVGASAVVERWREASPGHRAGGGPRGVAVGDARGNAKGGAGDEEAALAALLTAADGNGPVRDASESRAARGVLARTAEYLGAGIADLVNLFNPERIVLGGWAGLLLGPRLLPAVREAVAANALRYPSARTVVELGRLGPDAVTVGAATLPLRRFLDAGGSLQVGGSRSPGVATTP
jgi:predicted NBD/HSP70 family sugar kinase